jgi:hypothetical protein
MMDKITYDLFISMLYLKQAIENVEKIFREEEHKKVNKKNYERIQTTT